MRHFKLVNNSGVELDITTKSVLFHEISGLGFEEDNDFRQVGDFWMLNRSGRSQGVVGGSVIFTDLPNEELGNTPYEKYKYFANFIASAPLTLKYNPFGPIVEPLEGERESYFRRTVRVSKLSKSEYTEQGVLDCEIEFVCYTPWFSMFKKSLKINVPEQQEEYSWTWGSGDVTQSKTSPYAWSYTASEEPLIFESTPAQKLAGATSPIFRFEISSGFEAEDLEFDTDCPIKLTIFGPLSNPSWTHRVLTEDANGNTIETVVGTGKFAQNQTVNLATEDDYLVIDGTDGNYRIYQGGPGGAETDLYAKRDFGTPCFITFKKGRNVLSIVSSDSSIAKQIVVEGHIYHATV